MQRKDQFVEGEYYHLYNRGNSKQVIFLDDQDRDRFVKLLYLCNSRKSINFREDIVRRKIDAFDYDRGDPIVSIGAWVLMSNHFHVFITIPAKSNSLPELDFKKNEVSIFMQKVLTSYSKYFNKKYGRTGGLFETNFKSSHTNTDNYTKYIFSYIHLNPLKLIQKNWKDKGVKDLKKAISFLSKYEWSSYSDYTKVKRKQNKILSIKDFPDYFGNPNVFKEEIFEWLLYNRE